MPLETTPRILTDFSLTRPPVFPMVSSVPTLAKAILSFTRQFGAPQTTVSCVSAKSTDQVEAVGIGVGINCGNLPDNDVFPVSADNIYLLDLKPGHGQLVCYFRWGQSNIDI